MKNEKRREKKKTTTATTNKAWDESDDESDDGDIGEAFKAGAGTAAGASAASPNKNGDRDKAKTQAQAPAQGGDDKPAWPVEDAGQGMISEAAPDGGGPPDSPIPIEPAVEDKKDNDESQTAILSPPPPGPSTADPADPAAPTAPTPAPAAAATAPAEPEWRTASSRRPQTKPHPIQGGRQGPIGLAHPPPIEQKPRHNSRPRQDSSRKRPSGSTAAGKGQTPKPAPKPASGSTPGTGPEPEPRVRKEVKVRETGMGSLADRVKNLVIANTGDQKKKPASGEPAN